MKALSKILAVTGIGIVACIILVMVLVNPTIDKLSQLNSDLRDKKTQAKTLDQQILAFKSAQADLSRATERDRISDAVLDREDLVQVTQNVEAAADNTSGTHSISIVDLEPGVKLPPPVIKGLKDVTEVQYTLNLKNDFNGTLDFLKYLEHLPHFTELTNLRFTADTTASLNGNTVRTGNVLTTINGIFFVKGGPPIAEPLSNETKSKSQTE